LGEPIGKHIIAEFYGCDSSVLDNQSFIEKTMIEAANNCGATVLNLYSHRFEPYGLTTVIVLSESHFSYHNYVEYQYAAVDIFTCGNSADPQIALDYLQKALNPPHMKVSEIKRGCIIEAKKYMEAKV
jgi:S-adenosylmethionine decarboxylase proenzyme